MRIYVTEQSFPNHSKNSLWIEIETEMEKAMKLAEMTKLSILIREKNISSLVSTRKLLLDFVVEIKPNKIFTLSFAD